MSDVLWHAFIVGPGGIKHGMHTRSWESGASFVRAMVEAARPENAYTAIVLSLSAATPEYDWNINVGKWEFGIRLGPTQPDLFAD